MFEVSPTRIYNMEGQWEELADATRDIYKVETPSNLCKLFN